MEKIFSIQGIDKCLDVYDNKVVLTNKKMRNVLFWIFFIALTFTTFIGGIVFWFIWNAGNGKEKTIYIKNLKSIELKKPSGLINGLMQFNLDDSSNWDNSFGSENSIAFAGVGNYESCVKIRDFIEEKIA